MQSDGTASVTIARPSAGWTRTWAASWMPSLHQSRRQPVSATTSTISTMATHSTVVNLLNFTRITLPATYTDKKNDVKDKTYQQMNDLDDLVHSECKW